MVTDYFRWLTTTKLSIGEINTIIASAEKGMASENWQVHVVGNFQKVRKIRLILDTYPNGENGGNHDGPT